MSKNKLINELNLLKKEYLKLCSLVLCFNLSIEILERKINDYCEKGS